MANVTLNIPDDIVARLQKSVPDISQELRLSAAFALCRRGELSTSLAARLAGMTYAQFLEAAARAKFELFPLNIEEFKEEIQRGFTLGRERIACDPARQSRLA
jgi:predicted HTH domain antitoxin